MLLDALAIAAGLGLLLGGAEGLVRGASSLARRLGLSPLVIGLTVVSFGTSAPELVVCVTAALDGRGAIAVGNVVGSNISNIGLILGVAALVYPLRVQLQVVRTEVPIMLVVSGAAVGLLANGMLGRGEGLLLVAGLLTYLGYNVWAAQQETTPTAFIDGDSAAAEDAASERADAAEAAHEQADGAPSEASTEEAESQDRIPVGEDVPEAFDAALEQRHTVGIDVLLLGAGLGGLILGANWFVGGATGVAETIGVSEAVIGLTVVAVGTSLPELATSAVAAARGAGDLAIGNVVGSNVFNLLGILGVTATIQPLVGGGVGWSDYGMLLGLSLLTIPVMRSGYRISRVEGAGLLLLYSGYVAYLFV